MKEAILKYEKMCAVEDEGGRPVHRAREWQQAARRLGMETKTANRHKQNPNQISAPLILEPLSGNLTKQLKEACSQFQKTVGILSHWGRGLGNL